MNDGSIEAIIREMMPEYASKVLLAGNEEYSSLVLVWEDGERTGTSIIHLFDVAGEPIGAYSVQEADIRRGMKVIQQMRDAMVNPKSHPTRIVSVES